MNKRMLLLYLLFALCMGTRAFAVPMNGSSDNHESRGKYSLNQKRSFKKLDPFSALPAPAEVAYFSDLYYEEPSSSDLAIREQIEATYEKVVGESRFVKFLDENTKVNFPVGIKSEIGALEYTILIDSIIATPTETLLYASMRFEAPKLGVIHFRGADIRFSKEGGIVDGGRLELVGDYPSNSEMSSEKKSQIYLKGDGGTYVNFDCNGFESFGLHANLVFSRDVLLPEDGNGEIAAEGNVAIDFQTTVSDWGDLLVAVDVPTFRMKNLDGFSFEVDHAVIDWSDTRNQPGVTFPTEYSSISPYFQAGTPELWQGVFIGNLTISLPQEFAKYETEDEDGNTSEDNTAIARTSFSAQNMILDDEGFSGIVTANNLISIEKGKLGNWKYSLEQIQMKVLTNNIENIAFSGQILVPIAKDEDLFDYSGTIQIGGDYQFVVANVDTVEFPLFKADVTLLPSSYVEIKSVDGAFRPKANLNGRMDINIGLNSDNGDADSDGSKNVSMPYITFQNLQIQSVKPYVQVGEFSLGTGSSGMGGFPIQINEIGGGQSGDDVYLDVDITLSLTDSDGGGFGAGGDFRVFAEPKEGRNLSYKFEKLQINGFSIDIDQGAFKFSGNLNFYKKDAVYGNGISGTVDATFSDNIKLTASAIFGNINSVKYWYVDALANLGNSVPIFTGIYLSRFGGGASYHMALDSKGVGSSLGKTASGMVYIPDRTVGLGLKAMVGLKVQDEKLFNADATFEMAFNTGGGLRYINFRGNAYLLSVTEKVDLGSLKEQSKSLAEAAGKGKQVNASDQVAQSILGDAANKDAPLFARVNINYDFDEKSLHATLDVVINVAGGVMTGGGHAVMHFDRQDWYIYIGRPEPENRFSMVIMDFARTDTYFVMGSIVPDTPPPPSNVAKILSGVDMDYMNDLNALADGAGVGFGSSFSYNTGNLSFLIFYGHFAMGSGFDVMLKNYGNASCSGRGSLGIDGWYANGQAYAYVEGEIGIKVKLFGKTQKVDILNIGLAALLQAKLPNPIWIKGTVGGRFKVLGGLVKGNCSFEIEIGEECELINNSSVLAGEEIVAQLTPQEGASEVDVFVSPQAVFNYQLETTYETIGYDDERITFKIALDELKLVGPNGQVDTEIVWNDDKKVAVLKPADILDQESEFTFSVSTSFQEFKNGVWETSTSDGEELRETKTVTFTSGLAPDDIPRNNVAYSYPSHNMLNFYQDEYDQGYVKLNQGQPYLFADPAYTHVARFTARGSQTEVPITYDNSKKEVTYKFPDGFVNGTIYQLEFMSVPVVLTDIEANVASTDTQVDDVGVDSLTVTTQSATGTVKNYEETQLFIDHFRTSLYHTFDDKVVSVHPSSGWRYPITPVVHMIGSNINGNEPFSMEEIYGVDGATPLIRLEADLTGNAWYKEAVEPLIYASYPFSLSRDVTILGRVPVRAVDLYQYPYSYYLTNDNISTGNISFDSRVGRFDYCLAMVMSEDLSDLQTQAANSNYKSSAISKLLSTGFPAIRRGDYWTKVNYQLPGRETVTSSYRHKIVNSID